MGDLPALTMVIGGAASGKSDFAEQLVINAGGNRTYIATAQAFDDEMVVKIERHKSTRAAASWTTFEVPKDIVGAFGALKPGDCVLIDCATLWLTNLMMDDADISTEVDGLLAALTEAPCPVVVVTNETGQGIVPANRMAREFRQQQGQLNRRLAKQADLVVQVVVGLPQVLKGSLPENLI